MAARLCDWVYDDEQPRRKDFSRFPMKAEQKVERRTASRFHDIAKLLLENRSLSKTEGRSRLEPSRQHSWHDYR